MDEVVLGAPVEDCNNMPVSNIQYHTLNKFDDGDYETIYMVSIDTDIPGLLNMLYHNDENVIC